MTRVAPRRLVALIALLCQVATAVHVPIVHAHSATTGNIALGHCAEHAQHARGIDHPGTPATDHLRHPAHTGSCGCGLCQCPCAQAPASVGALSLSPAARRPCVTARYRLPDVPQPATAFFRPPI